MLEAKRYVPLLRTGVSEIDAFRNLYPSVKDLILPIFQISPWQNASFLKYTVDKIQSAMDGRPFGLALDASRCGISSIRYAQTEFDSLFDENLGFKAYYDFIGSIDVAIPTLFPTRSSSNLLMQIGRADDLNRGLIVHQTRNAEIPVSQTLKSLPPLPNDTVFVVDAGWSRNYISLETWTLPAVRRIVRTFPDAEIVVMASSFPANFSHIVGSSREMSNERRLFASIKQVINQANLTYGDWGSTRPRKKGGGNPIPSRIDVPMYDSWQIFRASPDDDNGYAERAWEASHHPSFAQVPQCWGRELVAITDDNGVGITSIKANTSARINMHLTVHSEAESILPLDEVPYED